MAGTRQSETAADSWTRDERAKARRLADVKRGSKTRRHFQTLAESTPQHRIPFPAHDGTTFSFSATDSRVGTLKSIRSEVHGRHSCPTLPAISTLSHDRSGERAKGESNLDRGIDKSTLDGEKNPMKTVISRKKRKSVNLSPIASRDQPNFPKFNNTGTTAVNAGPSMNSSNTKMSTRDGKDIDSDSRVPSVGECSKNKAPSIERNQKKSEDFTNTANTNLRRKSTTDLTIPRIRVQDFGTTAPLLRSVSEGVYKADDDGNRLERAGPFTESTRRYSVLISGGTLTKHAPYVDRVKPELVKNDISESPPSKMDRLQYSDSVDQSQAATSVPAQGHGCHLRSRKELFAFQQDLLLPRYRKLAGISENISGNASVNTSGQSSGGKGGPPDPEEGNDTQRSGANQRSNPEEVFEKVRLIIQGPTKEVPKKGSQNNGKRRQAMPIYLKSGLPCGYVDPSSKCDAWLDANDFTG